jgi:integrase
MSCLSITNDLKKVFYSFRHTVADTLKQAGVETSVISELLGHSHDKGNMTLSRYGKRYRPKVLLEALMKLNYLK